MPDTAILKIYDSYFEKALAAEKNRKPTDGMFGIGKKPGDDPCHTEFAEVLEAALKEFAASAPDSAAVSELLAYMYGIPKEHQDPKSVYWMLIAVHGLTAELIPRLGKDEAEVLYREYGAAYRRWERLPVQQQIYRALAQAAK